MPFEPTSWSLILQARADASAEARETMSRPFVTYWPPAYAFIRCRGQSPPDAEKMAQAYSTTVRGEGRGRS